jgi:microcystin-dependent protein
MQIIHDFVSAKADGPDSTRLRPSNWNADHTVLATNGPSVIGRAAAGPGAMTEIPMAQLLPIGVILPYGGPTAPAGGWLFPFGQLLNRTTYALLFAVYGTIHGAGDGVTTFGVPDLRGVVPAGKADMGGSNRGNLAGGTVLGAQLGTQTTSTSVSVSVSGGISGSTFGSLSVSLGGASVLQDAPQAGTDLTPYARDHVHAGNTSGSLGVTGSFSGSGGGSTGGITTVQPTIVLNYIMNAGV